MAEQHEEKQIDPSEARGRTFSEKVKNCDEGMKVVGLDEVAAESGATGAVFVEDAGEHVDCAPLISTYGPLVGKSRDFWMDTPTRRALLATSPELARRQNGDTLMFAELEAQIAGAPPEVRPFLQQVLSDAKQFRALFPKKKLMGISLVLDKGPANAQNWHRDGERGISDSGITRIIKTYHGPGTEFASEDGARKVSTPKNGISVHTTGPGSVQHRGPEVPRGQWRVRLQIELY
jgi:hypothetical protein